MIRVLADELGGDIEAKDDRGVTPLHLAAQKGYYKVFRMLS